MLDNDTPKDSLEAVDDESMTCELETPNTHMKQAERATRTCIEHAFQVQILTSHSKNGAD